MVVLGYNVGMSAITPPVRLTPQDVESASERDGKLYELIDGELKEKKVGFASLFIAGQILTSLNTQLYPHEGAAACEAMIYCFNGKSHGRKPDVVYVRVARFPGGEMPVGDLFFAPDLVVEVLSPGNSGIEVDDKLDEYLAAGVGLVWIVNPDRRTLHMFRADGTNRRYRASEILENEPLLPGFRLPLAGIFPPLPAVR
jgi:Uma2 family endonuclease